MNTRVLTAGSARREGAWSECLGPKAKIALRLDDTNISAPKAFVSLLHWYNLALKRKELSGLLSLSKERRGYAQRGQTR
jgi:hypothetical protein